MTPFKFLAFLVCLFSMACKKEAGQNSAPDKGILYDTAQLGTRINIGNGNYTFVYWGRNSDEIFVDVGTQYTDPACYQVDLLTKKSSRINLAEGFVKGRNFDNSSMVMVGRINNMYGYYLYHFNTATYSLLLKVDKMTDPVVNVSGNAVFYLGGDNICPLNSGSCAGWTPGVYFHFIDADSKMIVPLPKKMFYSFSKTGKRAVLAGSSPDSLYIFDNEKAMVVDSLRVFGNLVYFDDETGLVKALAMDNAGEVAIINARTNDIIQKFRPSVIDPRFIWSRDGTKLYYYDGVLGTTLAAGIYDLISKKETIFGQIGGIPFYMFPSVDNKKVLYFRDSREKWYIKNVQ